MVPMAWQRFSGPAERELAYMDIDSAEQTQKQQNLLKKLVVPKVCSAGAAAKKGDLAPPVFFTLHITVMPERAIAKTFTHHRPEISPDYGIRFPA